VREALIQLLCQTSGNDAVDCEGVATAFDMAQQARKEGHSVSAATLGILLDGATQSMDDKGLTEVLLFVDKELKKNKEWQNPSTTEGAVLLRRQIYARCRLRDGARALAQFRELKASGERVELRMYRCLIHALDETMVLDYSEADKILRKPGRTIDFLMQEMKRDQYPMTSEMLDLLLKIYGKAIRRVDAEEGHEMEALVQKMMDFAESFQQTDASGVQTSLINAKVLRQLIKAHCQAGMVEEAEKLLQDAHQKYNVVLKGLCFEPLIYYYGVVRGDLTAADDLLMKMVSRAVPLTQAVVASFAQGYIRNGAAGKALDVIQDLYNQHRVRAPVTVWTALLDNALARGDVHEARRVVYFIQQVFTPQERALLIGMRMDKTGMDSDSKNDEDNNWSEGYDSDYEGRRKLQSLPVELWRRRVPTGLQERGVLSDESLQRRFQAYGLSLQQK
jgi:pentatricopeptide repeat protein